MMSNDHMMHGSWDIKRDRQFFVILDQFLPLAPPPPIHLTTQRIEILKK